MNWDFRFVAGARDAFDRRPHRMISFECMVYEGMRVSISVAEGVSVFGDCPCCFELTKRKMQIDGRIARAMGIPQAS